MFFALAPKPKPRPHSQSLTLTLRHLGAFGLFFLAILDSSPLPTFGGPDILIAILAATHRNPWYEYAAVATAGSIIGAYITFAIAKKSGSAYLNRKFHRKKMQGVLDMFHEWGTAILATSAAVPFPFPTSVLFAAAGVSGYPKSRFIAVVAICRAVRYSMIAIVADHYGRHFIRVIRHPDRYWGWMLLFAAIVLGLVAGSMFVNRKLRGGSVQLKEAGAD